MIDLVPYFARRKEFLESSSLMYWWASLAISSRRQNFGKHGIGGWHVMVGWPVASGGLRIPLLESSLSFCNGFGHLSPQRGFTGWRNLKPEVKAGPKDFQSVFIFMWTNNIILYLSSDVFYWSLENPICTYITFEHFWGQIPVDLECFSRDWHQSPVLTTSKEQ